MLTKTDSKHSQSECLSIVHSEFTIQNKNNHGLKTDIAACNMQQDKVCMNGASTVYDRWL